MKASPLAIDADPDGTWRDGLLVIGRVDVFETRDENEPKRIEDRKARGQTPYEYTGQTKFIECRLTDDTGTCYVKIGRNDYDRMMKELDGKIEAGKTLIAAKGKIPPEAPVILCERIKVIGEM